MNINHKIRSQFIKLDTLSGEQNPYYSQKLEPKTLTRQIWHIISQLFLKCSKVGNKRDN